MNKHVAFLRAINVGGHIVKMDILCQLFDSLGFTGIETYIASGNVIFETDTKDINTLETNIEEMLHSELGFEVTTFIRTEMEVAAISTYKPFPESTLGAATALNVAFLKEELDPEKKEKLLDLKTEIDDFHTNGREIYWLCLKKQSESTFSNTVLEKALHLQSTFRGINTVRKLTAKYLRSG